MRTDNSEASPVHVLPGASSAKLQEQGETHISIIELWRILVDEHRMIGSITASAVIVALIIALFSTPVYQASVLMAPSDPAKDSGMASAIGAQLGGFAQLAGINLNSTNTEENIAILKSRTFTEKFIREENLMPILFEERWDRKKNEWRPKERPFFLLAWVKDVLNAIRPRRPAPAGNNAPTVWEAYRKFNELRSVSTDSVSGLVTLKVTWKDPQLAAEWANKLVERLNNHVRLWTRDEAHRSQQYIDNQLAQTGLTEMRQILHRLLEEQVKTVMLTGIREEFAFRVVDPAVVPERPVWPKSLLLMVIGVTLGGLAGISAALMRVYIRKEMKRYAQITGKTVSTTASGAEKKPNEASRSLAKLRKWASKAVERVQKPGPPGRQAAATTARDNGSARSAARKRTAVTTRSVKRSAAAQGK